jgi:hypothetical protein
MFVWTAPAALARTMTLIFPFTFGVPFELSLQVSLTSSLGYSANGETGLLTGHAFANLLSTGVFGAATVYDQFGVVNAPGITSGSGFDYAAGFVEPAAVPEPGTGMVVTIGLVALAALNRKRVLVARLRRRRGL